MAKNDAYKDDGAESQVRSIIKQLNEERPSKEKSRELVVRPDGSKVVRVIKKRKVMISKDQRDRTAKRRFLIFLLGLVLVCGAMAVLFSIRMSAMSGESYIKERQEALSKAWGASAVSCNGAQVSGFTMTINSLVAEFPENSMLERVELRGISARLNTSSFFSGVLESDEVTIENAIVHTKAGVEKLAIPLQQGGNLWKFKRVNCDDLTFSIGEETGSPITLKHTKAYMYHPAANKHSRVLIMNEGLLQIKGWKPILLSDGKMQISATGLDDIRIRGSFDIENKVDDSSRSELSISGHLNNGDAFTKPFEFESANVHFADLTSARFQQFFTGTTEAQHGKTVMAANVVLPIPGDKPQFYGTFRLKGVRITSFPALMYFTNHLEPMARKGYMPPTVDHATVELRLEEGNSILSITEGNAVAHDLLSLRGTMTISDDNQLSGTLDYGIPARLTHIEYPDGLADPVFKDDGTYAWFNTQVSGPANAPTDNAAEIEAQAEPMREGRPARVPFDEINVDEFSAQMKRQQQGAADKAADTPQEAPAAQDASTQTEVIDTPKTDQDSYQTLPTGLDAFGTGNRGVDLTLPTDDSLFKQ